MNVSCSEPEHPDPDDLAGHQLAGPDRGQQELDHPGRLLLDHARRHPDAVPEQLPVQQEHDDEGDRRRSPRCPGHRVTGHRRRPAARSRRRRRPPDRRRAPSIRRSIRRLTAAACTAWVSWGATVCRPVRRLPVEDGVDVAGGERVAGGARIVERRRASRRIPNASADAATRSATALVPTTASSNPGVPPPLSARSTMRIEIDDEVDQRRDDEAALAQAHPEVATGHERPHAPGHAVAPSSTTSRNSWASVRLDRARRRARRPGRGRGPARAGGPRPRRARAPPRRRRPRRAAPPGRLVPVGVGAPDLDPEQTTGARGAERRDRTVGDHPPAVDQHHRVAEAFHELELVAREHHGDAARPRLVEQHLGEDVDPRRVEPRERFVEHQDVGLVDEGGGELDALLVPERQRLDPRRRDRRPPATGR